MGQQTIGGQRRHRGEHNGQRRLEAWMEESLALWLPAPQGIWFLVLPIWYNTNHNEDLKFQVSLGVRSGQRDIRRRMLGFYTTPRQQFQPS